MQRKHLVLIAALLVAPGATHAQLTLTGGIEFFNWEEDTSPVVTEDGVLVAFGIGYTQQRDSGLLLGYRGKLWTGTVDYTGTILGTDTPLTGTTGYLGVTNEVQARFRKQLENDYRRDLLAGLGLDVWERVLTSVQSEDFQVIYLRTGFEIDSLSPGSWLFQLGIKYPVWVREDAHLSNIGFDRNPELNPGGRISYYGQIGYRLDRQWNIIGYLDGYRFTKSNEESVNGVSNGFGAGTVFQPASDMRVIGIRLEWVRL